MAKSKSRFILPLAFVMTFLAGSSMGYWYLVNKHMAVVCNFSMLPIPQRQFGT